MKLKQLLSPAVKEWCLAHEHLSDDILLKEFRKWAIDNENKINESVKSNSERINEYIERGKTRAQMLLENTDDIDWGEDDWDDDDIAKDDIKKDDKPISGDVSDGSTIDDDMEASIDDKEVLSSELDLNNERNVYTAINILFEYFETEEINSNNKNTVYWSSFDVSKVKDMSALFAFTEMRNANLKSWDVSKVEHMEGMFYKSNFNNDSICGWNVSGCADFLRMFTYSDFNQNISGWKPKLIEVPEYDSKGEHIKNPDGTFKMIRVRADLPLIGAATDERKEKMRNRKFSKYRSMKGVGVDESIINNKNMRHILDYETFINEGFGDFIKKGIKKIKSVFKNITLKINNLIAFFDSDGEIIDASSPYTALNYIADGEVEGVTAFTAVKNEYLNDNVKAVASIVESPEYYGIIDKNSIEYRNYLTMVDMINEHYSKYGDVEMINEDRERVGFTAKSGGLNDIRDINSKKLTEVLNTAIKNVPAYRGRKLAGGAVLIWGAPGIGKSTIPSSVIKAWNEGRDEYNQKALMVVECGDLTVDGFSLPMPMTKTIGQYLKERPKVARGLDAFKGMSESDLTEILDKEIKVSGEAVKTWLPVYKLSSNNVENKLGNDIANGRITIDDKLNTETGEYETIVTETTEGGILLFDEFFRANEQVFKILMQILLNRRFNSDYQLGDKWAIIACSNRPNDDKEVSNGFDATGAVVGTRFSKQYNFIPNFDDWKEWALKDGYFDRTTIEFLMMEKDTETGEYTNWHTIRPGEYNAGKTAWPTPRTWSKLMVELKNLMDANNYDSIFDIPEEDILDEAAGAIGLDMAEKYVEFLSTHKNNTFEPDKVLNDPKYTIPDGVYCHIATKALQLYIDSLYSIDNLPSDAQMVNLFKALEKKFDNDVDNFLLNLYSHIIKRFGFDDKKYKQFCIKFPKFFNAFVKKYNLSTLSDSELESDPDESKIKQLIIQKVINYIY